MRPPPTHLLLSLAGAALVALLILPWWRNHTLLLDFYDYGLVMAAAGRMQLGEKPFVDFITPIQTLQFLVATGAEALFGPRYLSLTYSALVFILGSFAGLTALLWRPLGAGLALLMAACVVTASAGQHTIVWYNAMGVIWLAIVVWLTARPDQEDRGRVWRLCVVWAALWLGGMTKLTFQAAALAFAITFTLRSTFAHEISWRSAGWRMVSFIGFGVVAPVATELLVTGASLEQWLANVVVLPARFRTDMLNHIATLRFYLQTPHDYYHPLFFKFAGAWGVGLLAITVVLVAAQLRRQTPRATALTWGLWAALGAGAWICSAVLLATNMDIAYVSAAVPLVLATGMALAYSKEEDRQGRIWIRGVLGVAAISLMIPAWLAAWQGTRALWGHEPLERAALVSADDLPMRFGYLRGMKILPTLHADLQALEETITTLNSDGIPPDKWYFTHGTEWLVRAVPEARHTGLPLWLARGTTFSDDDTWALADHLETKAGVRVIFAYEGWNYWAAALKTLLKQRYEDRVVGRRLHVYQNREPPDPIEFAVNTHSNLYAGELDVTGGPVELGVLSSRLFYFGGRDPHRIDVGFGLYRLAGEMVGEIFPADSTENVTAVFRIFAREGSRLTDKLWEEKVELGPKKTTFSQPFSISPGGRPVTLTLQLPPEAPAVFGWRKLHTEHVGLLEPPDPWPLNRQLSRQSLDEISVRKLLGGAEGAVAETRVYGEVLATTRDGEPVLLSAAPAEIWLKLVPPNIRVAGAFKVSDSAIAAGATAAGLRVSIIAYKSGRFDVRHQRELHPHENPADREAQSFETWLPENSGWIGIVVTSVDGKPVSSNAVEWRTFRIW